MIKASADGSFEQTYEGMFRLETINNYVGPLIDAWAKVLIEDNRRGVMMGIDGDGNPMQPTKYRLSLSQTGPGRAGDLFFNAQGEAFNNYEAGGLFHFASLGGSGQGFKPNPSDNLKTSQYKKMTGPPLAPRGPASRVISNYRVNILTGMNRIGVEGGWDDIVSKKGIPFIAAHFHGTTIAIEKDNVGKTGFNQSFYLVDLPKRNLVGLRQWGKTQATKELNAWIKMLMTIVDPMYWGPQGAGHNPKYVRRKRS